MVTPELIEHIKSEFAKGKTREEVRKMLVVGGKWNEIDLSEAFRTVIPMEIPTQNPTPSLSQNTTQSSPILKITKKNKIPWKILIFVFLGVFCVVIGWFFWSQINSTLQKFSFPSFSFSKIFDIDKTKVVSSPVIPMPQVIKNIETKNNQVKDCGIGTAPDLKNSKTYENNAVLTCLGNSALFCEDARAVLKDDLFPTIFQVIKNQNTCNFQLSYGSDSTLVDIVGKKLAGQYISCPISLVKVLDETKTVSSFNLPNKENPSKYASEIYFYGILGLFIENNLDKNKIQSLGCHGDYIQSIIASYQKMQSKK